MILSDEKGVRIWDVNDLSKPIEFRRLENVRKAKLYPHTRSILCILDTRGSVQAYDTKSPDAKPIYELPKRDVLDFDYNPNKLHTIATGNQNSALEFWDSRKLSNGPVSLLLGHSHWVTSIEYNHYYDQLVVSGSTSTEVFLWRAISQSSQADSKAGMVSVYGEDDKEMCLAQLDLNDSVYVARWSQNEPWIYAALEYSGQLLVTHVPYEEKYKIMI